MKAESVRSTRSPFLTSIHVHTRLVLCLEFLLLRPELHLLKPKVYSDLKLMIGVYHGSKPLCSYLRYIFPYSVLFILFKYEF